MLRLLKFALIAWCLFSVYWYVCEMNDHNCGCIIAKPPPVATDTNTLDSLGRVALAHLTQQDTMHFLFANRIANFYADTAVLSYIHHLKIYLDQAPHQKISLYGYSDSKGNTTDNLQLAQQRIENVFQCLRREGISAAQIDTTVVGEIGNCPSTDESCLYQYRRVDAWLVSAPQ